ncbi:MAG: response regulator, partial [Lachnospiraceae bacterium]|nr:response regulator [Lachnospiraceae bacterium]
ELFTVIDSGKQWLIENIQSLFIIVDSNYCYKDANAYAQHVFPELRRLKRNSPIPENIRELFTSPSTQFEIGERHYERSVREISENGLIQGYGLLMVNVTEQYRLRKEAEAAKEAAEAANEAKSAFISNMSHEIRTPMNAIVGMTDILLREETKPDLREYLENIKSSGDALLSIINDIHDISKIESGKMEIIEEEYEPMSLLSDLSMIFLNRIGDKPVELFYDVDPKLPSVLFGDAKRIRQILINIANNAIKFTDKGFVKVSVQIEANTASDGDTSPSDDQELTLRFSVQDTGQGIKEEDLPKLFGTFSQVDTRKNHEKEGSGLGLSISKNLVELMGGRIGVESVYGEGSRFWFTIPQKIVKDTPATALKASYLDGSEEKPVLCSAFSDERIEEQFQQLVSCYGIETVDIGDVLLGDARADFVFTDCVSDVCAISDEIISFLKEAKTALYILRNPMLEGKVELRGTVLNKPLYTLNFCNAINHEQGGSRTETAKDFLFTAPSARILLVDDTEMNLKVAIGLLEPLGMTIETAENGKRAVEKVSENSYDLVLMDHMMPVMDGIEATSAIRKMGGDYEKLPIIALTANATTEAQKLFEENGLNDFVAKPIKMKEICKCLAKWLPSEKISKQEAAPEGPVVPEKETDLPSIEGIDSGAGIENSGSEQLWRSLLSDFYKLIDRKSTTVEKYLADGMLRDYTIEVHALKNTARMVGALRLSDDFYRLEQLGNEEKEEELNKIT